jgi:hypothetical protein
VSHHSGKERAEMKKIIQTPPPLVPLGQRYQPVRQNWWVMLRNAFGSMLLAGAAASAILGGACFLAVGVQ